MSDDQYVPSKAEFLADLLSGNASFGSVGASVQRSHRFPLHLFIQIENMARIGGVPVSLIINQLLECGLDAVLHELPEDIAIQVNRATNELLDVPSVTDRVEVKAKRSANKPKLDRVK